MIETCFKVTTHQKLFYLPYTVSGIARGGVLYLPLTILVIYFGLGCRTYSHFDSVCVSRFVLCRWQGLISLAFLA